MADNRKVIKIIAEFRDEASAGLNALAARLEAIEKFASGFGEAFEKSNQNFEKLNQNFEKLNKNLEKVTKVTSEKKKAEEEAAKATERHAKETEELIEQVEKLTNQFNRYKEELGKGKRETDKAEDSLKRFGQEFDKLARKFEIGSSGAEYFARMAREARALAEAQIKAKEEQVKEEARLEAERNNLIVTQEKKRAAEIAEIEKKLEKDKEDLRRLARLRREQYEADQERKARERAKAAEDRLKERDRNEEAARKRREAAEKEHQRRLAKAEADLERERRREELKQERAEAARKREDARIERERLARARRNAIRGGGGDFDVDDPRELGGFSRALYDLARRADDADTSMRNLSLSVRGFIIAGAIKYAQALATAAFSLGGELIAVASSASLAGAALAGGLASGAAQAIPVLGLLAATMGRVREAMKVIDLQEQQELIQGRTDSQTARRAEDNARRIANAEDRVISARERLADANRSVRKAQEDLSRARKEAAEELEDLILAEHRARLAAEGAALSQEEAQRRLKEAIRSGTGADVARAQLELRQGSLDQNVAALELQRTAADARAGARGGVEGTERVRAARERLADSERQAARASRELARAQRDVGIASERASDGVDDLTSAQFRLNQMLANLSPAERELVGSLQRLRDTYRKNFRPITDIIVSSFSNAVERVTDMLENPQILGAFEGLANQVAVAINRIVDRPGTEGFLITMINEASEAMVPLTDIALDLMEAFQNIAVAADPVFDFLVEHLGEVVGDFKDWTDNTSKLDSFFENAVEHLDAWFDLIGSIWGLFKQLISVSAGSGLTTVKDLAKAIDNMSNGLRNNARDATAWFEKARVAVYAIVGALAALGRELFNSFSLQAITDFAEFLEKVVIPALGTVIRLLGALVRLFHEAFSQSPIAEITRFLATIFLLQKGLDVLRRAMVGVGLTLLGFLRQAKEGRSIFSALRAGLFLVVAALEALGIGVLDNESNWRLLYIAVGAFLGLQLGQALLILMARMTDWAIATGRMRLALIGLNTVVKASPLFLIGGVIAGAAAAFFGFKNSTDRAKESVQDMTDAVRSQLDAMRALADFELEKKDRQLALERATLRRQNAVMRLAEAEKRARDGGVITAKEAVELKEARNEVAQAYNDEERARRNLNRVDEDGQRIQKDAIKRGQEVAEGHQKNVDIIADEIDELKDRKKKLDEKIEGDKKALEMSGITERERRKIHERIRRHSQERKDLEDEIRGKERAHRIETNRLTRAQNRVAGAYLGANTAASILGVTVGEMAKSVVASINDVLEGLGIKPLNVNIKSFSKKSPKELGATVGKWANLFGDLSGMAGGGWVGMRGERGQDAVPTMLGRGEAVLNWAQQSMVEPALRRVYGIGLDDLFRKQTAFHAGGPSAGGLARGGRGNIVPVPGFPGELAARSILDEIAAVVRRWPSLVLTDAFGPGHKSPGHTRYGTAADFSGPDKAMDAAVRWLVSKGYKVGYDGRFGSENWPGHGPSTRTSNYHFHVEFDKRGTGIGIDDAPDSLPRLKIDIPGAKTLGKIAQGAYNVLRKNANKFIDKQFGITARHAAGPGAGFNKAGLKDLWLEAGGSKRYANIMAAIALAESSGDPKAHGPPDGRGLWQIEWPIWSKTLGKYGNPYNPLANARMAREVLERQGLGAWVVYNTGAYRQFLARGGRAGADVPILAKAGEMVLTPEQQAALGGTDYLSSLFGFNRRPGQRVFHEGGIVEPEDFGLRSPRSSRFRARSLIDVLKTIEELDKELNRLTNAKGSKGKEFAKRVRTALEAIVGENGLLAQLTQELEKMGQRQGRRLVRLGFDAFASRGGRLFGRRDPNFTELDGAQQEESDLRDQREFLGGQSMAIDTALRRAQARLRQARKRGDKKAAEQIEANINRLREFQIGVQEALANNLRDLAAKNEEIQQKILDRASEDNNERGRITGLVERIQRAMGTLDPVELITRQIGDTKASKSRLEDALRKIQARGGNPELEKQIRAQIDDLNVSIIELSRQQLDAQIEKVNQTAEREIAGADRTERRAGLLERMGNSSGAFKLRAKSLAARGTAIRNQIGGLTGLLEQARAAGNTELVRTLTDQIADLNLTLEENTVAIRENTIAEVRSTVEKAEETFGRVERSVGRSNRLAALMEATGNIRGAFATRGEGILRTIGGLQAQRASLVGALGEAIRLGDTDLIRELHEKIADLDVTIKEQTHALSENTKALQQALVNQVTSRGGFLTGAFGNAVSFFQAFFQRTGGNSVAAIRPLLEMIGGTIRTTLRSLINQFKEFFGFNLTGNATDMVNQLVAIINANPRLHDNEAFRTLVEAIFGQINALEQNTQQLKQLTGQGTQSFSSTAWQLFRMAIFNGSGGLLPQYSIPQMASGGFVRREGLVYLHAGEVVKPYDPSMEGGGDVHVHVTNPTEVLDPHYVGEVLHFKRSVRRATT